MTLSFPRVYATRLKDLVVLVGPYRSYILDPSITDAELAKEIARLEASLKK